MVKDADKLFRFSQEAFTLDVERFSMKPRENWERLYASLDEWFFTDFAKELAIRELQNLEKLASR